MVAACSSSSPEQPPPPPPHDAGSDADANVPPPPTPDAGDAGSDANDAGTDAHDHGDAGDAGDAQTSNDDAGDAGDGGTLVTELAPGADLTLWGVTSDGFVAYSTPGTAKDTQTVNVIPLAGGKPEVVKTIPKDGTVEIDGAALFLSEGAAGASCATIRSLGVWTKASGLKPVSAAAMSQPRAGRLTPDGKHIVYLETDATCTKSSLIVAGADGSGSPTTLHASTSTCVPSFDILATGAVVTSSCSDTKGSTHDTVTVFAAGTLAPAFHATGAAIALDPKGSWIYATAATGTQLLSATDGKVRIADPKGQSSGAFDGDAFYFVSGGALKRVALGDTSDPTTVVAADVSKVEQVSADGKTLVLRQQALHQKGFDLVTLATSTGTPTKLLSILAPTTDDGTFTVDSGFLIHDDGTGDLIAWNIEGNGHSEPLGSGFISHLHDHEMLFHRSGTSYAVVDAKTGAPKPLIASADKVAVGDAGKKVVYVTSGKEPGLYAIPTP